ncbi:MAG: hypothetical protein JO001_07665 [Alphaproteobacteria bacterium]|nr:hypothetical protein [Alphaproteobacteria bacterium]
MAYDAQQLLLMTQAQLDALFTNSPAGDIPDGEGHGTAIIAAGAVFNPEIAAFINHFAWQGKIFDAKTGYLKNKILPFGIAAIAAKVSKGESWFDRRECIVLDYSETSLVPGWTRDEIRMIEPGFYLGAVYFNHKRLFHFSLKF